MAINIGFDAGMESVKLVVFNDGKMIYSNSAYIGNSPVPEIADKIFKQAIEATGISINDIRTIAGTGTNTKEVTFIQQEIPETIATPLGINWVSPQAHTLIDIGASKFYVLRCRDGRALKISRSDKCASGAGVSLRMVANVLALKIEDIGALSLKSGEQLAVQTTCSAFLETEIISLLHHYKRKTEDILKGVFLGMASRFYSLLLSAGLEDDLYMIGGVAKNVGVVKALEEVSKHRVHVPPDPFIIGAIGAVLAISDGGILP